MTARSSKEAYQRFLDTLSAVVGCITYSRLSLERQATQRDLRFDIPYAIALNNMDPVPLRTASPITLSLGLHVSVRAPRTDRRITTIGIVKYFYSIATVSGDELLSFHWTPNAVGDGVTADPHLHVGHVVVSDQIPVRARTFHKMHIPTGYVSPASIVRLAIVEFGAQPITPTWESVLSNADTSFWHHAIP